MGTLRERAIQAYRDRAAEEKNRLDALTEKELRILKGALAQILGIDGPIEGNRIDDPEAEDAMYPWEYLLRVDGVCFVGYVSLGGHHLALLPVVGDNPAEAAERRRIYSLADVGALLVADASRNV